MSARANLRAVLGLDSQQFRAGMRGAGNEAQSFRQQIGRVGAAIGVAFSATAVISFARQLATWAADLSVTAQNVGLLTAELMALNRVAGDTNVKATDLQNVLGMMRGRIMDATDPLSDARREIEGLGVDFEELIRLSPADQFVMLAKAAVDSDRGVRALSEAFGVSQRQAVRFAGLIRNIANEGMPELDESAGRAADRTDKAIDRMRRGWDRFKTHVIGRLGEADAAIERAPFWERLARRTPWGLGATLISPPDTDMGPDPRQEQIDAEADALVDATDAAAEETARILQKADEEKAAAVQDQIDKERRARLDGLDRMAADHSAWLDETASQMERAGEHERAELQRLMDFRQNVYAEDVAAHKAAEAEKEKDAMDRLLRPLLSQRGRLTEQMESLGARVSGVDMDRGGMARIGGFFGGERAGMEVESKQLRVQQESKALLEQIADLSRQLVETQTRSRGA